jgi:hypothetical protein
MTEEDKAKERLEKIKASKRKWWREHGKAWKQARKVREALEQNEAERNPDPA